MKNITLSAEEAIIEKARAKALREHTSLNKVFRGWLKRYIGEETQSKSYKKLMQELNHVKMKGPESRDYLNER